MTWIEFAQRTLAAVTEDLLHEKRMKAGMRHGYIH